MVFPYRTSLSLSYDVPPDRVPEVLLHLMRALEDVSFGRGCCFVWAMTSAMDKAWTCAMFFALVRPANLSFIACSGAEWQH